MKLFIHNFLIIICLQLNCLVQADELESASIFMQAENHYRGNDIPKDLKKAAKLYTQAANLGYPKAQNMISYLLENGIGIEKDLDIAFEWNQKAAESGYPVAQLNLSQKYLSGIGTEKNEKLALHWCEKAAMAGQKNAMFRVSQFYMNGIGTRKNYARSLAWYNIAFEAGAFAPMGIKYNLQARMDFIQNIEAENLTRDLRKQVFKNASD